MKRALIAILMMLSLSSSSFADTVNPPESPPQSGKPAPEKYDKGLFGRIRSWDGFMVGSGGTVGTSHGLSSGGELSVFRDDYNHEITLSADLLDDLTSYAGKKLLVPVLANYRWYVGPDPFKGIFFTAGLGEAIPFGLDHGSGSLAWGGAIGYAPSKRISMELRYIGRRRQQVTNGTATLTTDNTFYGAMVSIKFF